MLSGHGANPIFFNKKREKIAHPEHSITPHPPTSKNISFLLYTSHPTPQSERHMCIIPKDTHSLDVLYHQRCYNKFTLDYKAAISNQEAKDSVEKAAAEKRFLALLKTQMINQKSCFLLRGLLIEIKIMKIMVVK